MKKHPLNRIGRYLTTAIVTSAMLEASASPLLSLTDSAALASRTEPDNAEPADRAEPVPDAPTMAPPEGNAPERLVADTPKPSEAVSLQPTATLSPERASPQSASTAALEPRPATSLPLATTPAAATAPSSSQPNTTTPQSANPNAAAESSIPAPLDPVVERRRIVEANLANMVARNRLAETTLLRQNLIASALQYAKDGQFELARQVAQHPSLSATIQLDLLAKIAKIEARQAKKPEVIEQAIATASPNSTPTASLPSLTTIPPGLAIASGTVPSATLPGTYLSDRCLATDLTATPLTSELQPTLSTAPSPSSIQPVAPHKLNGANPLPQALAVRSVQSVPRVQSPNLSLTANTVKPLQLAESQTPLPLLNQPRLNQTQAMGVQSAVLPFIHPLDVGSGSVAPATGDPTSIVPPTVSTAIQSVLSWWTPSIPLERNQSLIDGYAATNRVGTFGTWVLAIAIPVQASPPPLPTTKLSPPKRSVVKVAAKPAKPATTPIRTLDCSVFKPGDFKLRYTNTAASSASATQSNDSPSSSGHWDWGKFRFPLPIPTAITSAFGWRIHPISGDRRFHSGLDFGAPMGTPVLAAITGKVILADTMGGYGLAVVIENGAERNLYGHLSGIAVQPGTQIQKGSVIGWVGSTGNSTGPHLHFESHLLTTDGWVAVDPLAAAVQNDR